jgi:transcription termination factor Rho
MVIEKRNAVEHKRDVVILLDSITVCRAHNAVVPPRENLSGGIDSNALQRRNDFSARREHRRRRSLTIIATALIDTGFENGRRYL